MASMVTRDQKDALVYAAQVVKAHSYSTCFSGIDAPGTAAQVATHNLSAILGVPLEGPKHLSACEKYKPSRDELMAHPSPPQCCFSDVCDFWKQSVRGVVTKMKKAKAGWSRETFMPTIRSGAKAMNPNLTAYCCVHRRPWAMWCQLLKGWLVWDLSLGGRAGVRVNQFIPIVSYALFCGFSFSVYFGHKNLAFFFAYSFRAWIRDPVNMESQQLFGFWHGAP